MQMRRNQHVVFHRGKWCVHAEATRDIQPFSDKSAAVSYAREKAQELGAEAIVHKEDGAIETAWIYSIDALPQERLLDESEYPVESDLGELVL